MLHLLVDTSLFVSLPNDCLCQMTGNPVTNLKPSDLSRRSEGDVLRNNADLAAYSRGTKRRGALNAMTERPTKRPRHGDPNVNHPGTTGAFREEQR